MFCILISQLVEKWLGEALFAVSKRLAGFQDIKRKPLLVLTRSMDMKDASDVSSYLLFEATGDSEADCVPHMGEYACEVDRADDDAQSCSYDGSETCDAAELKGYEPCNAHDEHEDEKKAEVYGTSYCEDDEMQESQNPCVSVDSGQELEDEMEKNRRFWEACLAS